MIDLKSARLQAARVRLSEDQSGKKLGSHDLQGREIHKDSMLRHGLLISESMTPELEKRIGQVCERLLIPRQSVTAFVYNKADVQADCVIDSEESCVLRFTSGLVNLMNEKEFQFVAAHELGHFLLGHGACSQYAKDGSAEGFMTQRARELSADRIGFLGVDDLGESIQAIIKTASGLGDEFLRYDVSSFMAQTELLSNPARGESRNSTHPSMLIRCRAMLWFSMSVPCLQDLKSTPDSVLQGVDKQVTRDLERFVDGQVRARKQELGDDIALWKSCVLIISEGSFKKDIQERLSAELGLTSFAGLKSFFELYSTEELEEEADKRLNVVISCAFKEFPSSAGEIELSGITRAYKIIGP
jgi:hypothetical protein|tara:strand:+ start:990 stop:2063 length:1074 start_codon:yes stop_codon:yes gene_type:complete